MTASPAAALGLDYDDDDPQDAVLKGDARMADVEEVWKPFAERFAEVALTGAKVVDRPQLPLLGSL